MEKIKEGEYIRTEYDGIGKVIEVRENPLRYACDIYGNIAFPGDITKHSPNIIDLIEVGDYVNGYKVSYKGNDYKPYVQCDYPVEAGTTNHYLFYEHGIRTIVTKEQFEAIKYVVGE